MNRSAPLALGLAILAGCRGGGSAVGDPVQRLEGLTLSQSRGRTPSWNLAAESAVLLEGDKEARLVEPRMEIFKDGKAATRITARAGAVRTDSKDVTLSTGVVATSLQDGAVLETSQLLYSSARDRLYTERDVVIRRKDGVVRGKGLEATPDLSKVKIFQQRAQFKERPG